MPLFIYLFQFNNRKKKEKSRRSFLQFSLLFKQKTATHLARTVRCLATTRHLLIELNRKSTSYWLQFSRQQVQQKQQQHYHSSLSHSAFSPSRPSFRNYSKSNEKVHLFFIYFLSFLLLLLKASSFDLTTICRQTSLAWLDHLALINSVIFSNLINFRNICVLILTFSFRRRRVKCLNTEKSLRK